jgi:putative Holliday junction resolvase
MIEIVFGFDFGIKRIGIAMGNTLTAQAQPLAVVKAIDNATRFTQIGALIDQWRPTRLVVGEPRHPDGAEHEMTLRCQRFANQLHGRVTRRRALFLRSHFCEARRGDRRPCRRHHFATIL